MENVKKSRYLNLLTDFGFKYVFAKNKVVFIHLLNLIINSEKKIRNIRYLPAEQLGNREEDRKAIYDIYCRSDRKEPLIFEMQVGKQRHFMNRALYYSSFAIQSQAKKGIWDFGFNPVYLVCMLNFILNGGSDLCIDYNCLMSRKMQKQTSDKLHIITVELPKFNKKLNELENDLDRWLYCFRHLPDLQEQPEELKGHPIFDLLFEVAEINNLTPKEMKGYAKSVAEYHDVQLMMQCSLEEGREAGRKEGMEKGLETGLKKGKIEVAGKMLKMGFSINDIAAITGLPLEQIRRL
jgi:predicted transposase/invertase (TIGR01784 family)